MKQFLYPNRDEVKVQWFRYDDLVPQDHEVRGLWAFVQKMDLSRLEECYKTEQGQPGRPAIHPCLLLALWLWGIAAGIVTSRALAEACTLRSDFRWLCGGIAVSYKTLSDFRSAHPELLSLLLTQGLVLLDEAGLINLEKVFIDGMKVDANASLKSYRRHETLEKRWATAEEWLAALEAMSETEQEKLSQAQLSAQKRHAGEKVERIQQALERWPQYAQERKEARLEEKETRVSTTDPDAKRMKRNDGGYRMSYNVQLGVTAGPRPVITAVLAENTANDTPHLVPMVEQVKERLGREPKEAVADNNYLSIENLERMEGKETSFYAPDKKEENNQTKPFSIDKFILADDEKSVTCPLGEKLLYSRKTSGDGLQYQLYEKKDCSACPFKEECCPKAKGGRTIKILQAAQRKLQDGHREQMKNPHAQELLKERQQTVELVNALTKLRHGLRQIWLRGKEKAQGWVELLALSFNTLTWIRQVWSSKEAEAARK
jgi:transposase